VLRVNKNIEPDFLLEFKRKNTPKTWNDYNDENIKSKIKNFILEKEQSKILRNLLIL